MKKSPNLFFFGIGGAILFIMLGVYILINKEGVLAIIIGTTNIIFWTLVIIIGVRKKMKIDKS